MDEYFAGVSSILQLFVFFDGFTCGQTNYYITVSQPVVNQVTNDL